ncbi:MAG: hypothetical protein ACE15C_03825 [Phycisphaerae bacterium]
MALSPQELKEFYLGGPDAQSRKEQKSHAVLDDLRRHVERLSRPDWLDLDLDAWSAQYEITSDLDCEVRDLSEIPLLAMLWGSGRSLVRVICSIFAGAAAAWIVLTEVLVLTAGGDQGWWSMAWRVALPVFGAGVLYFAAHALWRRRLRRTVMEARGVTRYIVGRLTETMREYIRKWGRPEDKLALMKSGSRFDNAGECI